VPPLATGPDPLAGGPVAPSTMAPAGGPIAPSMMNPPIAAAPSQHPEEKRSWLSRLFSPFHRGGGGGGDARASAARFAAGDMAPSWGGPVAPVRPESIRPAPQPGPGIAPPPQSQLPPALADLATGKAPGTTLVFKGSRGTGPHVHQSRKSQGNDQTSTSWKESRR
ncbi:MAG TPA: hypothetical protein VKY26_01850, partial [Actinomycetota bacterium]|nr:hypothetical protein [Actinomycetota bacterium]